MNSEYKGQFFADGEIDVNDYVGQFYVFRCEGGYRIWTYEPLQCEVEGLVEVTERDNIQEMAVAAINEVDVLCADVEADDSETHAGLIFVEHLKPNGHDCVAEQVIRLIPDTVRKYLECVDSDDSASVVWFRVRDMQSVVGALQEKADQIVLTDDTLESILVYQPDDEAMAGRILIDFKAWPNCDVRDAVKRMDKDASRFSAFLTKHGEGDGDGVKIHTFILNFMD